MARRSSSRSTAAIATRSSPCAIAAPASRADELPHVFDRYWQGAREEGGAGLGLAIAKGIVAAHGGEIRVRSTVGEGTEMMFTLPLAR